MLNPLLGNVGCWDAPERPRPLPRVRPAAGGDGEAGHPGSMPATAASRSATAAPPEASDATTRTVSSPATVPITPGKPLRSRAEPTTWAEPGGVRSTIRLPE